MKHEFGRHFKRRGFLFAVLGLPLLMFVITAGIIWFFTSQADDPVGFVDEAAVLLEPAAYTAVAEGAVPFVAFESETAVHEALMQDEIQAYFILPADYLQTGRVTLYHNGNAYNEIAGEISDYLRASLLITDDPLVFERFHDDRLRVEFRSLAEAGEQKSELGFVMAFVVGLVFLIAIFATSGQFV